MSKLYRFIINTIDPLVPSFARPFWEHEAGPKTIFFWSPLMKWAIVIAGIGDFTRPAETISIPQTSILTLNGFVWTRFSLVMRPKNYSLAICSFFFGLANGYNFLRAWQYQQSHKS